MNTSIICAFAFIALVNGQGGLHMQINREAKIRDASPYKHLLRTRSIGGACKAGDTKMADCNSCFCPVDGAGWACTRMMCLTNYDNTADTSANGVKHQRFQRDLKPFFSCNPHSQFMMDCNHCFCSPNGRSAGCTMMACPPKNFMRPRL